MATHASKMYQLLTRKEVAEMAGVTRQRVSQAVNEGKLACIPFGVRCWRFYYKDVVAWVRNTRKPATKFPKGYCKPV